MNVINVRTNKIKRDRGPNWKLEEKVIFIHCYPKVCKILRRYTKKNFNTSNKKIQAWIS